MGSSIGLAKTSVRFEKSQFPTSIGNYICLENQLGVKMKSVSLVLLSFLLFSACDKKVAYTGDCGPLTEFKVDQAYCEEYGLRDETFSLQYPANMELQTQEEYNMPDYAVLLKLDEDSMIKESLNIGAYYGLSESGGDGLLGGMLGLTKESLMTRFVEQHNDAGFNLQNVTLQDERILGEDHFAVRASFEMDNEEFGFKGKYIFQLMLIATGSDHGLLIGMKAREDSGILSFEDFEKKACIAPILQSIE